MEDRSELQSDFPLQREMSRSQFDTLSPSFNSYSSTPNLADIAARVVEEFRHESDSDFDYLDSRIEHISNPNSPPQEPPPPEEEAAAVGGCDEGEDEEFEFAFVCREPHSSPISADEIFSNGQIRPVFPLFNTNLLYEDIRSDALKQQKPPNPPTVRLPLGRLMMEDRDASSCSSSEAEELEGVPAETYCVWTPEAAVAAAATRRRWKKSSSTGTSSKRWKIRDLFRSNSDGKDTFVFLATHGAGSKKRDEKVVHASSDNKAEKVRFGDVVLAGKLKPKEAAEEADYVKSKKEDVERRRSFLPYKQDLVGLFSNMNGLSRNVHPF